MTQPSNPQKQPHTRWPGVLFSLLVPGFGLIRAGLPMRGVVWLLATLLMSILAAAALATDLMPIAAGLAVLGASLIIQAWMWYDSFRPGRMTKGLWMVFFLLGLGMILLPLPGSWVARAFSIPTSTMLPTLRGARDAEVPDQVLVDRLRYQFSEPQRGDVIVFTTADIPTIPPGPSGEPVFYVKRLVGLPGERITIVDGKLYANGRVLDERDGIPPVAYTMPLGMSSTANKDGDAFLVGEREYFVLGDNSDNSFDSRYWGCVPETNLYGKVTLIYYPLDRLGRPTYSAEQAHSAGTPPSTAP